MCTHMFKYIYVYVYKMKIRTLTGKDHFIQIYLLHNNFVLNVHINKYLP